MCVFVCVYTYATGLSYKSVWVLLLPVNKHTETFLFFSQMDWAVSNDWGQEESRTGLCER